MSDRKTNEIHRVPKKANESEHSTVKYLVLLRQGLLSEMRELSDFFTFQQDSAPAHRARPTVELLEIGKGSSRFHFSVSVAAEQHGFKSGRL